jgi:hypothetical protein
MARPTITRARRIVVVSKIGSESALRGAPARAAINMPAEKTYAAALEAVTSVSIVIMRLWTAAAKADAASGDPTTASVIVASASCTRLRGVKRGASSASIPYPCASTLSPSCCLGTT